MELIAYFEKFKVVKKVVEELNQSENGHAVLEILCREQNISAGNLGATEAMECIADRKEGILGMQLIMNGGYNKYGTLIKDYDREYLGRINKYSNILQDAYNLFCRDGTNTRTQDRNIHPRLEYHLTSWAKRVGKLLSTTEQHIHHTAGTVVPTTHWTSTLLESTWMEQCCTTWGRLKRWNVR